MRTTFGFAASSARGAGAPSAIVARSTRKVVNPVVMLRLRLASGNHRLLPAGGGGDVPHGRELASDCASRFGVNRRTDHSSRNRNDSSGMEVPQYRQAALVGS